MKRNNLEGGRAKTLDWALEIATTKLTSGSRLVMNL